MAANRHKTQTAFQDCKEKNHRLPRQAVKMRKRSHRFSNIKST